MKQRARPMSKRTPPPTGPLVTRIPWERERNWEEDGKLETEPVCCRVQQVTISRSSMLIPPADVPTSPWI
jgi:hypothetical protein